MAATPFDPSYPGPNLFDIYTDGALTRTAALPGGACNFTDLSPGANGAKCGCRRFWARSALGSPIPDQAGWCMCLHHACYHDDGSRDGQPVEPPRGAGQENERPRTGREPLSPVVLDMQYQASAAAPALDFPNLSPGAPLSFIHDMPEDPGLGPGFGPHASPHPAGSMPDTLSWRDFVQSPPGAITLPPIPSQCLLPSQTASTTSSVQARYLRPFAGKGLQTLSGAGLKSKSPLQQQTRNSDPVTPRRSSPRPEDSFVFVTPDEHRATATQTEPRALEASDVSQRVLKNLSEAISGHEQRLDRLETVSFSAPAHDDCQEKHDHADLRVTDLEGKYDHSEVRFTDLENRVEELEKSHEHENGSVIIRRDGKHDDAATESGASVATSTRPTHSQEMHNQLQSLQAEVIQLRSFLPSYNHAWEVEVVFLPFPLKKLWQDIHQFKSDTAADDWTQIPMTHSTATLRSQSPFFGDWATPDHDAEWLLPRACGDKSVLDRRLRSRGLVKTVSVRGPDARSVHDAINTVFGSVFKEMQLHTRSQTSDPRVTTFLGLQSAWVPLRKIHKDSRLRFLNPAEMVTPALWDVQFLSSVMMRSSDPRLFITHPDAYLQDYRAYEAGWTWQRVREMGRVYPDVATSQEVPEADALEDHWGWNELLDEEPNAHTSMSLRQEKTQVSSSPSQAYYTATQSWGTSDPTLPRGSSPMLKGRKGSRPPHIRTSSVPVTVPIEFSPAISRRRVVSYGHSRRSSPSIRVTSQAAFMKRRRTRSPSHPRHTPRWTASPSPMPLGLNDRAPARGTTPFAYATPHSNAPLQEARPVRGGSVLASAPPYASDEAADEDFDIPIYESESDGSYSDESVASAEPTTRGAQPAFGSQNWQLPEDEPWPGIEDREAHMSDGENVDPDRRSDASSQPSEYPSTQRVWPADEGAFRIHEDGDV